MDTVCEFIYQQRSDPLELASEGVLRSPVWVLGTKVGFTTTAEALSTPELFLQSPTCSLHWGIRDRARTLSLSPSPSQWGGDTHHNGRSMLERKPYGVLVNFPSL